MKQYKGVAEFDLQMSILFNLNALVIVLYLIKEGFLFTNKEESYE